MALRVLLADESTTIKKVMQLALQDFAVEVKTVHSGIDVLEVAKAFGPDIIFADVLLPKKSGYQVCMDLKKDPQLQSIPLVLMWSAFMDLDDSQAQESGANQRLEKPFDVENLRQIVLELVPKTRSQRLAHFLQFPDSVTQPLRDEFDKRVPAIPASSAAPVPAPNKPAAPPAEPPKLLKSLDDIEEEEELVLMPEPSASSEFLPKEPEFPLERMPLKNPPPFGTLPTNANVAKAKPVAAPSPAAAAPPPPNAKVSKVQPAPPVAPEEKKPSWSMDSFEDADLFGSDDEEFKEVRITGSKTNPKLTPPPLDRDENDDGVEDDDERSHSTVTPIKKRELTSEDRDPWSHQDLSRFKIDLPPVSVEDEDMSLEFPEQDIDTASFQHYTASGAAKAASKPPVAAPIAPAATPPATLHEEVTRSSIDDLSHMELEIEPADRNRVAPARRAIAQNPENDDSEDTLELNDHRDGNLEHGEIPKLSPERLEEIIRAQSREIIESVVRKIVPDIATDLIREELSRLLDERDEPEPARPIGPGNTSSSHNKERRPR